MNILKTSTMLSILALSACSSMTKQELTEYCQNTHWYSLGHAVGEKGENINILKAIKEKCGDDLDRDEIKKFQKGYLLGITTYCSYENGYTIGETGEHKPDACPYELSKNFDMGYRNGRIKHTEKMAEIRRLKEYHERDDISVDQTKNPEGRISAGPSKR